MVSGGNLSVKDIKDEMRKIISEGKSVVMDYVEIVDADTLEPLGEVKDNSLVAVAAIVGRARLIDNAIISLER